MKQQFYKDDQALLEISSGVFTAVKVLEVIEKFGKFYYEVSPIEGAGQMRVEKLIRKHKNNHE